MKNEQEPDGQEPPAEFIEPGFVEIDSLLDGEAVDRNALRSALADAAVREYFVEALVLRQLTRDIQPSRFIAPARTRGGLVRGMRWIAALVTLVVGTSIGYVYGQKSQEPSASSGSVEVVVDDRTAPPAPEPTRRIRFEPGVNWTRETRSR
jgi:hypothetical protein